FRYGGAKQLLALRTGDRGEAERSLSRFETNLRLIDQGVIDPPPDTADVGLYVLSAGKLVERPSEEPRRTVPTLGSLFHSYRTDYPAEAKEGSTRRTERIHLAHLERVIGPDVMLPTVTRKTLQ